VQDDVDPVLALQDVGVHGETARRVDGEARRRGALLLLGRSIHDNRLFARRLLARLLGGWLLGGGGCLGHVVVVFGRVVVVVVFVVVVFGRVVVLVGSSVVVVVCNLETRGGDISNDVKK
jgi:hypothetical protein